MQKSEINILIVDDDETLGKAMREAFIRSGVKATHVMKPDDALSIVKLQSFHAAVVDCMLPKMNGRMLAKKLRETNPELPILLTSGIYRDKNFAREAIQETGAIGFLVKPFDLKDLVSTIESKLDSMIETPLASIQALFMKEAISHKERIKTINDADEVHGYELPWIFSLLMHKRVKGFLNIVEADGQICGVGFNDGKIVQVNQSDAKSYFGVLLVEYGFISQEELDEVMKQTGKTKKMGERLVEANVLSPHAISIVMSEQQGLRLSKTIAESAVKVNFVESDDVREDAETTRDVYTELLNEWMLSKIKLNWLKSTYLPWLRYNVRQGGDFVANHRVFSIPVLQRTPDLMNYLLNQQSLGQALIETKIPEEHFYASLHALILSRVIRFGDAVNLMDQASQQKRLTVLLSDLEKQNYYDRLHVIPKAKEADIKRSYHDLAKILHPDKLASDVPQEIRELTKKCFALISAAYDTLADPEKKAKYAIELEKGKAESIIAAEQLTETARPMLTKGDFKKALGLLEEAQRLAPPTSELRLLLMWAQMKVSSNVEALSLVSEKVGDGLLKIPPEDRHTATFYFVRGLHLRFTGDFEGGKKNLAHAVSIDADFIDARRELLALNGAQTAAAGPKKDLLRGDLKDVVGMLFKKKK